MQWNRGKEVIVGMYFNSNQYAANSNLLELKQSSDIVVDDARIMIIILQAAITIL